LDSPTNTNKTKNHKPELDETDLYDDLPPGDPPKADSFGTAVISILVNEIGRVLQDMNKALDDMERTNTTRRTAEGQVVQVTFAEGVLTRLKQSGLEEILRQQLARLQASPFRTNLETTLRQYWEALRERSQRLRAAIERQRSGFGVNFNNEEYRPEEYSPDWSPNSGRHRPPRQPMNRPPANNPAPDAVAEPPEPPREFLVDIFDEPTSGEIVLIAECPGLLASTIRVTVEHDILTLTANDAASNSYSKECLLPAPVDSRGVAQKYRNGVLEVRLKKKAEGNG
jgi:HSP20 family molecular chaperone IbpA